MTYIQHVCIVVLVTPLVLASVCAFVAYVIVEFTEER